MRWADYGLPPVQTDGYEVTVDAGLIRDQFAAAEPEQRRITKSPRYEFTAAFVLTNEQMPVAVDFLESVGHKPFWLSVIVPDDAEEPYAEREVRLIERYEAKRDGDSFWRMKCRMEVYLPEGSNIEPFDWGTPVKPCDYFKPPFHHANLRRNDWWPRGHFHPKLLFDWYPWGRHDGPYSGLPRRYAMGTGNNKVYDWWGDVYATFPLPKSYICGVTEWNDRLIVVVPSGVYYTQDLENTEHPAAWNFYAGSEALYSRAKPFPSVCNFHMDGTRGVAVYQDTQQMTTVVMATIVLNHESDTATVEYQEDHQGRCGRGYFYGHGHGKWDMLVGAEWRDDGIWLARYGHALTAILSGRVEVKVEKPNGDYYYVVDGCHGSTQQVGGLVIDLRLEVVAFLVHYYMTFGVMYQISYKTLVKCRIGQDGGWISYDAEEVSCFYFSDSSRAKSEASRSGATVSVCDPQAFLGWFGFNQSPFLHSPAYISDATRTWFYPSAHFEGFTEVLPMAFRFSHYPLPRT